MTKIRYSYILLFSFFTFASLNNAVAQRFGYVDMAFVLSQMPEYGEAQTEINNISLQWQEDIQNKHKDIQALYSKLETEKVLLTKEMYNDRLDYIRKKENEVKEYHNKVFGYEGLLFLKKKELISPLREKVDQAVEKVAKDNRLQMIFDKSGDLVMIYTDPIYDFTEHVLEELGIGVKEEEGQENN